MPSPEMNKVLDAAWNKGFAFGKYTQDIQLSQDILSLLDNSNELMREYLKEFSRAVTSGMLETMRD